MRSMIKRSERTALLASLVAAGALCFAGSGAYAANITVGSTSGGKGSTATLSVTLQSQGTMVLGTQNDIDYQPQTPVAVSALGNCGITTSMTCTTDADCPDLMPPPLTGKEPCVNKNAPDCVVKAAGKGGFFAFEPSNCTGTACTGIRALIFALNNVTTEIPDGSELYSCNVNIAGDAADGDYALTVPPASVSIADTNFQLVPNPTATDGKVTVGVVACSLLVCDVAPSTGDGCSQFGNNVVNNSDVVAIFRASLLGPPAASSARFNAMDAITADNPPTCGGNNSIVNNDVVACFKRSLLPTEPNYNRSVVLGTTTCTSTQKQP